MTAEAIEIVAADGYRLYGTLHRPAGPPSALVLIHPATAVPERLYLPFAEYLTEQGFAALTYDYRGIGRSAPTPLRKSKARMRDWLELDVGAVTTWARQQYPQLPLLAVGHSVGGHALGISDATHHLSAAVMIASHAGYYGNMGHGVLDRLRLRLMLSVIGHITTAFCGYLPARALRFGEDLPKDVFREWERWCSSPHFFFDDPTLQALPRFADKTLPLLVLGFDDDPLATPRAITALVQHFTGCTLERRQIAPKAAGAKSIGHMGFFRRASRPLLWPQVSAWLAAQIEQRAAA